MSPDHDEGSRDETNEREGVGQKQPTVDEITVEEITEGVSSSKDVTPYLARIGFRLTIWLLGLIVVVFVWVGFYAYFTQPPTLSELREAFPDGDPDVVLDNYENLQTVWFGQIKDLLQLLVVSLLIPLVATVIGYIFGRREETAEQSGE